MPGKMTPTKIILHCSDSPNGKAVPIEEIRNWHLQRGFKDIGYHIVIQPDGRVERGRGLNEEGAHCQGENHCSIGICLVGRDKYTVAQFRSLESQIDGLFMCLHAIPHHAIYCHYQLPSAQAQGKTCPNIEINRLLLWYHAKDESAIKPYILKETP